jgi:hypothetical protein
VSVGTCGISTSRVWLGLGYDFSLKLANGDDNVLLAVEYDFTDMLSFLQNEVGMGLYVFNNSGQSSLELAIEKASFSSFGYLVDYYVDFGILDVY